MAYMPQTKNETDLKSLSISKVKNEYLKLAETYNKMIDGDIKKCPVCGEWISTRTGFYADNRFADGLFYKCKNCVRMQVEQRTKKNDVPNETIESVKKMLQEMDLPYIHSLYDAQCKIVSDATNEKNRSSPFLAYLVPIKSLPQYIGKHYCNSEFASDDLESIDNIKLNQKKLKNAKKRFGTDYNDAELDFLETEYQDWVTRHECNTKAQEEIFKNLSTNRLERKQAVKQGRPTKEIDKTFQELLAAQNIQPRQSSMDTFADAQTFGTLIKKYEETRPLPEIDPELADVDKIGLYIDTFYRGHASKMLGIKNSFSHLYEKVMSKYVVTPPEYDDESDSEVLFEKIFGSIDE